jgi:hypothetical protein
MADEVKQPRAGSRGFLRALVTILADWGTPLPQRGAPRWTKMVARRQVVGVSSAWPVQMVPASSGTHNELSPARLNVD